ncbi:hypothetical protein TRAPUB_9544 [Trametes pubescens]|uniref:F-box domain-containing protein n=1 Tax=Trametes pubescens TaxID=154538 RepID=A0A1M2W1W9_TRAPU|nr:hypothetical protein TRAPUB_9544 [Trametes pubescens]
MDTPTSNSLFNSSATPIALQPDISSALVQAPPSPGPSLPSEIVNQVVDACDLLSILALRKCSCTLYAHTVEILLLNRRKILRHYVPNPDLLWEHLEETRAVIAGLAALSFILRDLSLLPATLDLYTSSAHGGRLEQLVEQEQALPIDDIQILDDPWNELQPNICRSVTFATHDGRYIAVNSSASLSPLDPIAASPTTAVINWVSPYVFACGYPALTLRRQSLGLPPFGPEPLLHSIQHRLCELGFDIRSEPAAWPDYTLCASPPRNHSQQPCLHRYYVCPRQGRFFGNKGSLLMVFNLADLNLDHLAQQRQPPFGVATAWRLLNAYRDCDGCCVHGDPLLPDVEYTLPLVIVGPGFSLRGMPPDSH